MRRYRAEQREEERRDAQRWKAAEKRFVRSYWQGERLVLACLLDPDRRAFSEAADERELADALAGVGAVAALDPCAEIGRIGLDPGSRILVDLRPPVRTRRLYRAGRTLAVTPELVLRGTLKSSRPLGSKRELAGHVRAGRLAALRRRLISDLKSLHALFEYGRLHGYVRLHWGPLDELLDVGWKRCGGPILLDLIGEAHRERAEIEVVLAKPPGWDDPWEGARLCEVLAVEGQVIRFLDLVSGEMIVAHLALVFAARQVRVGSG